ncbi:unnamed protein product [Musa banksii]
MGGYVHHCLLVHASLFDVHYRLSEWRYDVTGCNSVCLDVILRPLTNEC